MKFLISKINKLLENGSDFVAIQFDDIPEDFYKKYKGLSEGKLHATLCNFISEKLKIRLFLVPEYIQMNYFLQISFILMN